MIFFTDHILKLFVLNYYEREKRNVFNVIKSVC